MRSEPIDKNTTENTLERKNFTELFWEDHMTTTFK